MPRPVAARRRRLAATALAVVAAGLAVSTTGSGPVADLAGGALYAVLVWIVAAFLAPRRGARWVTAVTMAVCAVVELAQLTDGPAAAAAAWWPLRYVLGTTFVAADLAAYAVGAALAGAVAAVVRRPRDRCAVPVGGRR